MLSQFKPIIDKTTQTLVTPLKDVNPNFLTLIGIVPSLLFFIALQEHWYAWSIVFFLGNIFDMLDGAIAKRFHKVTPFGGFLDSTLDRISDFLIIMSFAFAGIVVWQICILLLAISYLVSYSRSRAELASKATKIFAVGLIERTERLAIIFFSFILYLLFPDKTLVNFNLLEMIFMLLILLSLITFVQRILAAYTELT